MLTDFATLHREFRHQARPSMLLVELNSWDKRRMDEFDYDRRLKACKTFAQEFNALQCYPNKQVQVVLYQLIHTLHQEDFALRKSALDALLAVVKYVASNAQQGEDPLGRNGSRNGSSSSTQSTQSPQRPQRPTGVLGGNIQLLETVLMPAIKAGIRAHSVAVRKTFVVLLSELSTAFEWMDVDER
jgi:hypothetical protein